jgi:hypothetical protein
MGSAELAVFFGYEHRFHQTVRFERRIHELVETNPELAIRSPSPNAFFPVPAGLFDLAQCLSGIATDHVIWRP